MYPTPNGTWSKALNATIQDQSGVSISDVVLNKGGKVDTTGWFDNNGLFGSIAVPNASRFSVFVWKW
ncbi:MAG: hypothetical protein EP343_03445 [Deltaproteobacteria bacterium]|nr:MAG: hypothetical protein EP343_03445 [Deltaproteobacteria bacterium]